MKLSILICSLESRAAMLGRLMLMLEPQKTKDVEILVRKDRGAQPIGAKRNDLVNTAVGEYVCFVDDDDNVSYDYVSKILTAIEKNPDCCGIEGEITTDGKNPKKFIHSKRYSSWYEQGGIYYRCPNHLNPIKRNLVSQVAFPSVNSGEDHDFSKRIFELLNTEEYIDGVIYHYMFLSSKARARQIASAIPRIGRFRR